MNVNLLSLLCTIICLLPVGTNGMESNSTVPDLSLDVYKAKLIDFICTKVCEISHVPNLLIYYKPEEAGNKHYHLVHCGNLLAKIMQDPVLSEPHKMAVVSYIQNITKYTYAVERIHVVSSYQSTLTNPSDYIPTSENSLFFVTQLPNLSETIPIAAAQLKHDFNHNIMAIKTLIANIFLRNINNPVFIEYHQLNPLEQPILIDTLLSKAVKDGNIEHVLLLKRLGADLNKPRLHLIYPQSGYQNSLTLALKRKCTEVALALYAGGASLKQCCYINGQFELSRFNTIKRLIHNLPIGIAKNTFSTALQSIQQDLKLPTHP